MPFLHTYGAGNAFNIRAFISIHLLASDKTKQENCA